MEPYIDNNAGRNRSFLIITGILGGIILLSIACLVGYAFYVLPRQTIQRAGQEATLIAADVALNTTLTAIQKEANTTATGTPSPFLPYTIDMYGINMNLPMGWKLQETNRRPEPTGIESLAMGHDCADYVIANPEGNARLALYPPCGATSGGTEPCPADVTTISPASASELIVRYFDATRGAYVFTQAFLSTPVPNGQSNLACNTPPILALDDMFLRVEFQYVGVDSGKDAMLKLIDQIVLSIKKR
ncbi:MAG: hypothetical protein AB1750_08820 [Chloroflexota bacterium]